MNGAKRAPEKSTASPYGLFRHTLKCVAKREGVVVEEIKPNYTSQTCPRCGHVGKENWRGYVYFRCTKCGYEADRDRVASLNIAERATRVADPAKGQIPLGNAQSTGTFGKMRGVKDGIKTTSSFKPLPKGRGS
ncbi:MAG: transposase [Candidatus Asgardarchaeia archaeon]